VLDKEFYYRSIVDSLDDGVAVMDREGHVNFWNQAAERITGIDAARIVGHRCADHNLEHLDADGMLLCSTGCPVQKAVRTGDRTDRDVFIQRPDGQRVPARMRVSPLRNQMGEIVGAVEIFTDNSGVAEALQMASDLQDTAYDDSLTGLGNRRFSEYRVGEEVERRSMRPEPLIVGFVDIDHFKRVNDQHGHARGDLVLQTVADVLRKSLRGSDYVGRWGGEEFIFLLPGCSLEEGTIVAERSRAMVEDSQAGVTISLGLTPYRNGERWEQTVARADQLMYQSKQLGRNRVTAA
jgi:diguanylate cyclase (GGDEF)-like protein/PAS domain S-box-containing protein